MRKSPTQLERRIQACLSEHGKLGYVALLHATEAANSPALARTLNRMRQRGVITRSILDTSPPRTLYALADPSTN
jgi:DNA-binding HxlR family transcriptional regulator